MDFTTNDLAKQEGISLRSAQRRAKRLLEEGKIVKAPEDLDDHPRQQRYRWVATPDDLLKQDLAVARAKENEKDTKQKYRAAMKQIEGLSDALDLALGLEEYLHLAPCDRRIEPRTRSLDEVVPVMLVSDGHCGESVDPESINHLNTYTPEIAVSRHAAVFRNGLSTINRIRAAGNPIKQMLLWLGGDFVNGYIHDEYKVSNALAPPEELLLAFDILKSGIDFLLENSEVDEIVIVANPGNHGRMTDKIFISAASKTSLEWMLYHLLRKHYAGEDRLHWHIAEGYMVYQDILDCRAVFHHGESVRGGRGVGGLTVPLRRAIMKWHEQTPDSKQPFHFLGHFHQLLTDCRTFMVNGSIVGFNAYAQRGQFPYEPPTQGLALIAPGHRSPVAYHTIFTE